MVIGLRLIGVLIIIKAIQGLVMSIPYITGILGLGENLGWAISLQVMNLVNQLVLLVIGIYLLSGMKGIVNRLYPSPEEAILDSSRKVFNLAMKITGLVLVVYSIPDLLNILSNGLYIGYYHRFAIDTFQQQALVIERSLATLVSLILGFYILVSGRFFENIAFKDDNSERD
ncbi:MAG: hypothetical protein GX790_05520 [Syntrophomonadaceae bacterium]|nr:hypothetical protein [Syntrophomonadaceae bacterium]